VRSSGAGAAVASSGLGAAVRASLTDYYFNSVRLVPVNLAWGAVAVAITLVALGWPIGGTLGLPLLSIPAGVVFAMAAAIARGGNTPGVRDALVAGRAKAGQALLIGTAWLLALVVLATNVVTGIGGVSPLGWLIATLAGWGLAILWCAALVVWPLLFDPAHPERTLREDLRLCGTLLLVAPIRFGALGALTAMVVVVSTILTAAVLTISVSFVALVACRTVYPVADRLESPLTRPMA
jgi:hypothetical protein